MTSRHRVTAFLLTGLLAAGGTAASWAPAQAAPAEHSKTSPSTAPADPAPTLAGIAYSWASTYLATQDAQAYANFAVTRDALAAQIAQRLQIDPAQMQAAWQSADLTHQVALLAALGQLGVPYRAYQSRAGHGFDCSGLTQYAWGQAMVAIPRSSRNQIRAAAPRTRDTAQAGDLVYYPGHVMMWLGVGDAIVHAPNTGRTVELGFIAKHRSRWARFGDPVG